jgi:hypothetical protein
VPFTQDRTFYPNDKNGLTSKIYVDNRLAEKQPNILSSDNLTCNSITVSNTTPIENNELTSKIYVDNGLAEKTTQYSII